MTKTIIRSIFIFALTIVVLFVLNLGGLEWRRFFGVQEANVQRDVFEHSKSYVDGKVNHLNQLRADYELADTPSRKAALRTIILREASQVDVSLLPFNLQQFINSLN